MPPTGEYVECQVPGSGTILGSSGLLGSKAWLGEVGPTGHPLEDDTCLLVPSLSLLPVWHVMKNLIHHLLMSNDVLPRDMGLSTHGLGPLKP